MNKFRSGVIVLSVLLTACFEAEMKIDTAAAARGEKLSMACAACHSLSGNMHRIGPSLEGIVGRDAGSATGYSYSEALQQSGITWTPENLIAFIKNPTEEVPGTKMAFGEISDQEVLDIVEFLKTL